MAVAQFAPALLGGMYWKGGTRAGALAGLALGFALWAGRCCCPRSPSPAGCRGFPDQALRPRALQARAVSLGLTGLDSLTHALLWSLLANLGAYVAVSRFARPSAREASQRCCSSM